MYKRDNVYKYMCACLEYWFIHDEGTFLFSGLTYFGFVFVIKNYTWSYFKCEIMNESEHFLN